MDLVMNTEFPILEVIVQDGSVRRPKLLKAKALPMRRAIEWLDEAKQYEQRLAQAESGEADPLEALTALADFVAAYDPNWPAAVLRDETPPGCIVSAFYALKELNDPFAAAKARKKAEEERGLRMLEALGGSTPEVLGKLVEKHSSNASAGLAKSSE